MPLVWIRVGVGWLKGRQRLEALKTASERNAIDEDYAGLSGDALVKRMRKHQR